MKTLTTCHHLFQGIGEILLSDVFKNIYSDVGGVWWSVLIHHQVHNIVLLSVLQFAAGNRPKTLRIVSHQRPFKSVEVALDQLIQVLHENPADGGHFSSL